MPAHRAPGPPPDVPGFRLDTLLGSGGSGEVWRAVPRRGGAAVAVKLLAAGDAERQVREAQLLAELDHPHLVRLHQVVQLPGGGVALVLDLLAGGSLAALLARRGRLRPGEVVTALAPLAGALAHAHDRGVVHGDLAPGNVLFTAEGRPVLADLGTGRLLGDTAASGVTASYVDPTVARGAAVGPASDVFGVAAVAFAALTGVPPWNAADPEQALAVARSGALPDLAELAPDAPADLVAVLLRALDADPHRRGTAAELALDLRHACRPEPVHLPAAGVADADLGLTGQGPRTELTYQRPGPAATTGDGPVGGRRGRHGVAAPGDRRPGGRPHRRRAERDGGSRTDRRRRAVRERGAPRWPRAAAGAALALVTTLVVVAAVVVLGARWGRSGAVPVPPAAAPAAADRPAAPSGSATAVPDGGSPVTPPAGPASPAAPTVPPSTTAPADPAGPAVRPVDAAGWAAVVGELYRRRAAALAAADPAGLGAVYTADSAQQAADRSAITALAAGGRRLRGFDPRVGLVSGWTDRGERVEVRLVDSWADYAVVAAADPGGPTVGTGAGRPATSARLVLAATPGGWRIASAERTP